MRKTRFLLASALLLTIGSSVSYAQDRTPPDTNVRDLEVSQDVRNKQLRAQTPPSMEQGRSEALPPVTGSGTTTVRP